MVVIFLTFTSLISGSTTAASDFNSELLEPEPNEQVITSKLVNIEIFEEGADVIKPAYVGPGDLRSITFNGNVTIEELYPGRNLDQVFVSLKAEIDDEDWAVMITPPVIVFPYSDGKFLIRQEKFLLMILAPFRAPVGDHIVTVTGQWMASPTSVSGEALSDSVKVTVVPFPDLLLNSLDSLIQTSPGDSLDFIIEVHNRGNNFDDFLVEILNEESLNKIGWSVTLESSTVEDVPSWGYKNVTIRVRSPQRFTIWKNQITEIVVRVSSLSAAGTRYEEYGDKEYPVFYYERGVYFPPEPTICSIIGIVLLIVIVMWWRKRQTKRLFKEVGEEEDEEPDN